MCLSPIEIPVDKKRPWLKRTRLVPCGKCEVCCQQKANKRAQKIINDQVRDGSHLTMFVTLTYDNEHVPYVRKSESVGARSLFVYRGSDIIGYVRPSCMQSNDLFLKDGYRNPVQRLKPLHKRVKGRSIVYDSDKVGVLQYGDLQKFLKRLRINLIRKHGIKIRSFFSVSEYGSTTCRPHFHLLIQCRRQDYTTIEHCIYSSWTFCDWDKLDDPIEIAKNAATYVSGYVAKSSALPLLFQDPAFRPKHSHSLGFGLSRIDFALPSLLEKIDKGDFDIPVRKESITGKKSVVFNMPIPSYVLHRYFPPIKGLSSLSSSELFEICLRPTKLKEYASKLGYYDENKLNGFRLSSVFSQSLKEKVPPYQPKDFRRNFVRLVHCIHRFCNDSGLTPYDYARYFTKYRVSYQSYLIRKSYDDYKDELDHYDNIMDAFNGKVNNEFLRWEMTHDDWDYNPKNDNPAYYYDRMLPLQKYVNITLSPRHKANNDRILEKVHNLNLRSSVRSLAYGI